MTTVYVGNPNPQMQIVQDGQQIYQPADHLNQSVTTIEMRPDYNDVDEVALALSTDNERLLTVIGDQLADADKHYAIGIFEVFDIMDKHAAGQKPTWVTSDDADFARVLGAWLRCPVGDPNAPAGDPDQALLTNAGRDAIHAQTLSTSAQPASFTYMALTASVTAPAATDTTLTGEITTAGGGLLRAVCTYAHTTGTNTSTLTKAFVANGSDALPVTIAQIGVFNASSSGTLGYHTALSASATLSASGDSLTNTWTATIG